MRTAASILGVITYLVMCLAFGLFNPDIIVSTSLSIVLITAWYELTGQFKDD